MMGYKKPWLNACIISDHSNKTAMPHHKQTYNHWLEQHTQAGPY
jgi:hypothetical protein